MLCTTPPSLRPASESRAAADPPLVSVALTPAEIETLANQLDLEAEAATSDGYTGRAATLEWRASDLREAARLVGARP